MNARPSECCACGGRCLPGDAAMHCHGVTLCTACADGIDARSPADDEPDLDLWSWQEAS